MPDLVVIPTFNEAMNVEAMVRDLRAIVPDAHVLVVDDASPDGTAAIVEKLAVELGHIDVLARASKSGLGSAYRDGFAWGLERAFDHFVEIDCDFSHDPRALPTLLEASETFDVVIGSRYVVGGTIPRWTWARRLLSRGGNRYASYMLGLRVADATSGYRVYSRHALETIDFRSVTADGYGFQIEMTYRARRRGASITEVPISFKERELGASKMSSAIIIEAFALVLRWAIERLFASATSDRVREQR